MADKKISQLTAFSGAASSPRTDPDLVEDFIPIIDGTAETKKINLSNLGVLAPRSGIGGGTAYVGGDQSGNPRGSGSLDIQSKRNGAAWIAKGEESVLIGSNSIVTGNNSVAVGRQNEIYANDSHIFGQSNKIVVGAGTSSVVGRDCKISGARSVAYGNAIDVNADSVDSIAIGRDIDVTDNADGSIAVGNDINMSGLSSLALGLNIDVSGNNSAAFGRNVKVNANSVTEIGGWHSNQTRGVGVRLSNLGDSANPSGAVCFSLLEKTFSPLDGGADYGDEEASELPREMFSMRRNSDELLLDVNVAGTVKTVSLGDATRVGADDAEASRTSIGSAVQNVRADGSSTVKSIRRMTQLAYNDLVNASTVDANTLYVIVG